MKPSNIHEAIARASGAVLALIDAKCDVISVAVDAIAGGMTPRILVARNHELDQLVIDEHAVVTESCAAGRRTASIHMRGCYVSWLV
jgi:hypothetical protein